MTRKVTPAFLILAGAVGAAWFVLRPPPAPPPQVLHPTKHQVAQAQQHLETLGRDLNAPEPKPKPGTEPNAIPKPRTLHLSEQDLNTTLAGSPSVRRMLAAHGVGAVQIVLAEPAGLTILASVLARGHLQNVQMEGTLAPDAQNGLRFTASHAQAGRFPVPASAATAQANALLHRLVLQMHRLPISVQSVAVEHKDLVIVGLPLIQASPLTPASPRPVSPDRR